MNDFNSIALIVEPWNTSGSYIKNIGEVFLYGNEEFGPRIAIFKSGIVPRCVENLECYQEHELDMLALFNLVKSIKLKEIFEYKPSKFVELDTGSEGYTVKSSVNNIMYMNYLKKSNFSLEELPERHSYLLSELENENVEGIIKSNFFVDNLLVAASTDDVFLIAFLWSEAQRNKMYFFINMYKIYEIMNKKIFNQTENTYKIRLENALRVQLRKSKSYLGSFANNAGSSGIYSRHGGSTAVNIGSSIEEMIEITNREVLWARRLYFARITM